MILCSQQRLKIIVKWIHFDFKRGKFLPQHIWYFMSTMENSYCNALENLSFNLLPLKINNRRKWKEQQILKFFYTKIIDKNRNGSKSKWAQHSFECFIWVTFTFIQRRRTRVKKNSNYNQVFFSFLLQLLKCFFEVFQLLYNSLYEKV